MAKCGSPITVRSTSIAIDLSPWLACRLPQCFLSVIARFRFPDEETSRS
jgi:hypothetical protein